MTDLYHFTCDDHGFKGIGASGFVKPICLRKSRSIPEPFGFLNLISWFTDQPDGVGAVLGNRVARTGCDRLAHRYRVVCTTGIVPWGIWAHHNPLVTREARSDLEHFSTGSMPGTWWVSTELVPVVLDDSHLAATG